MKKIKQLINNYGIFIQLPWKDDLAADQRVIFCVYDQSNELNLRARIDEFEIATRKADHGWFCFDLTNTFAVWMSKNRYIKSYFVQPELLQNLMEAYLTFLTEEFQIFVEQNECTENDVITLCGVSSLFGLLKVKELVDKTSRLTKGRLVVLFPGTFENNNYKLLDAYDGWNYLAVPITSETQI